MKTLIFIFMATAVNAMAQAQKPAFKASIDRMMPMSYPAVTNLTDFTFEMRNDSAFVYLPYMGEAYTPTFSNDGLDFSGVCKNVKVAAAASKKKGGRNIRFSMRNDVVTYSFNITLWDDKTIDLYVQPSNAQSCSYRGEWE